MSSSVGEVLVAEDVHTKKSGDLLQLLEKLFNAHSAPRRSEQNTIGHDTRIRCISRLSAGSAVQKDPEVKKRIVPRFAVFSAATSILTMRTLKRTIIQRARIDLYRSARLTEKIISISI
jgi:hypothetical protein